MCHAGRHVAVDGGGRRDRDPLEEGAVAVDVVAPEPGAATVGSGAPAKVHLGACHADGGEAGRRGGRLRVDERGRRRRRDVRGRGQDSAPDRAHPVVVRRAGREPAVAIGRDVPGRRRDPEVGAVHRRAALDDVAVVALRRPGPRKIDGYSGSGGGDQPGRRGRCDRRVRATGNDDAADQDEADEVARWHRVLRGRRRGASTCQYGEAGRTGCGGTKSCSAVWTRRKGAARVRQRPPCAPRTPCGLRRGCPRDGPRAGPERPAGRSRARGVSPGRRAGNSRLAM